jgi:hypothetical protein
MILPRWFGFSSGNYRALLRKTGVGIAEVATGMGQTGVMPSIRNFSNLVPPRKAPPRGLPKIDRRFSFPMAVVCFSFDKQLVIYVRPRVKTVTSSALISMSLRRGRPPKYLPLAVGASPTEEQRYLLVARELYEKEGYSLNKLGARFGFTSGRMSYIARLQRWQRLEPAPKRVLSPDITTSEDQTLGAVQERGSQRDFARAKSGGEIWTAGVISLVGARLAPKNSETTSIPLREYVPRAKATAPAATTREQVALLERYEALLLRYVQVLEMYFAPEHFVESNGLSEDQWSQKLIAVRRIALRILLPSDRGTVTGAIKIMTEALSCIFDLNRQILGINTTRVASAISLSDASRKFSCETASSINLDGLNVAQLRLIREAMELLERQRALSNEPARPPLPEPIDDLLLGPEADRGMGSRPQQPLSPSDERTAGSISH